MSAATKWVSIGRVGRPHGVKGGIRIWLHNTASDLLVSGRSLRLLPAETLESEADEVKGVTLILDEVYGENLVTFKNTYGRENVTKYTGRSLFALREDFPELSDDESYLVDLIGAEVSCANTGEVFGEIESFGDNGAQPLARVKGDAGIVEMPFAPGLVVEVSDDSKKVRVDAPIGLFIGESLEANAPDAALDRERARARRRKKEEKRKASRAALASKAEGLADGDKPREAAHSIGDAGPESEG